MKVAIYQILLRITDPVEDETSLTTLKAIGSI